ncbi:PLP-dependent transferase [Neocallimastix californiae]|jgi:kynurenine/2-aminoadipate aminotransferase|uniref:PLP-dependent transferase n=1 Tax=Neocallimastix californiae TaxID=1754190 RepID=A0A1Y2ERK1_9FUNG|nr:PLP-dependent transferase [Neocallimastix californiae]|eukprot:ORY74220.1 PLP-dependent transferase [Neocallimastix californiae]
MDYSQFLSKRSALRKPSAIRTLQSYLSIPNMISLSGGMPNPETFPYKNMSFRMHNGEKITLGEANLRRALQYSGTAGFPELIDWLRKLQWEEHQPDCDYDICLGNGSQDLLTKAFDMLIDEGDSILIEKPTYVGALSYLRPLNVKFIEVECDSNGINPKNLADILANWPKDKPYPKILYTVPTGCNPTGMIIPLYRKEQIYELAQKYNFLILEDDPYYYLQFSPHRIPSFFSMDIDGRVLRFDSFSKVISAGMRLGWVSGPRPLIHRIILHSQVVNLHPSGLSQMITYLILTRWGIGGFLAHVDEIATFYQEKRDIFCKSAQKYLNGIAEWNVPNAGLFVWIKLLDINDSTFLIKNKAMFKGVLLIPGHDFYPNSVPTSYVRASFSTATPKEIDEALKLLGEMIRDERNYGEGEYA